MDDQPQKLGKYEVREELGRGNMGVVYRGYDPFTDQDVAIKVSDFGQVDERTARLYTRLFFNEAHTAGMLEHPGILSVLDAGEEEDAPYIVMELIEDARTLKDYCSVDSLLPIPTVVEIAFKCAKALDYAHGKGVVHRDIKPTNAMLTRDGEVKICDFGIAQRAQTDATQVMGMLGSPRYMSPEQAQEEEVNNQTDLFSLGVVLYELLTGKLPFAATGFSALIHQIIHDDPPPMREFRADVPDALEVIVQKALSKDLKQRYRMGNAMAADLSMAFEYLDRIEAKISDEEKFNAVKGLDFFRDFSDSEIWEVIRASIWENYIAGDEIISEGNIEQSFYIIVGGQVIVKKASKILGALHAGDCFGEMGYLTKTKRTATILAFNDVHSIKVNATLIEQASKECQLQFHKVFLRTLVERLTRATELLSQN